jgi:cell division protein FtsW (lipid II flippase)
MRTRFLMPRPVEAQLLRIVTLFTLLAFPFTAVALALRLEQPVFPAVWPALLPALIIVASLWALHFLQRWRQLRFEQLLLPAVGWLGAVGIVFIWRLRGDEGAWQQLSRGWLPGLVVIAALLLYPRLLELLRRRWVPFVSAIGLVLLLVTAFIGAPDEAGARLALRLGPLPPIQTSEVVKLALIIFLAWYIERVGEEAEGRARVLAGWLRLPELRYFVPGILFVAIATIALVRMADFGAILIIGALFVGMLYAGFQPRIFLTIAAIGVLLTVVMALVLVFVWEPPDVIRHRFIAFQDPWSDAPLIVNGQPSDITIAEGPGYQIQQSLFAIGAGGLTGTGLGLGTPYFVPLVHSDFILAAIVEELGGLVALALLALYAVILLRLLRVAILLPEGQKFERLLLVGIAIHLFTQLFVMAGGTFNLLPLTGITVPFLSQGGIALLVNLTEIGIALALVPRLEPRQ